uniref:Ubiquitin-like domain-containing protein n=1 Tax=Angiostrongylus cantonensis TaxID=6313 RepID=A0A158PCC8_ANGCA
MPSIGLGDNNTSHESQFAAAAAIAVLGQSGFQVRSSSGRMDVVSNTANGSALSVSSVGASSINGEVSDSNISEGQHSQGSNIVMPMNISVITDGVENIQENVTDSSTDENNIANPEVETATVSSDHDDSPEPCSEGASGVESPPVEGDSIIRLKFLDDTQKDARATMTDTVAKFKSVHFGEAVAAGRVIRLIYQGQLLREDSRTLASYGLRDGCVVHCHISNTPYAKQLESQGQSSSQSVVNSSIMGRRDTTHTNQSSSDVGVIENEFRYPRWAMGLLLLSYRFPVIGIPLHAMIRLLFDRQSEVLVAEQLGVIRRAYRRFLNSVVGDTQEVHVSPFDRAADAAAMLPPQRLCLGDYLLWIFAGQFVAIWGFVYAFPQLCDSTALGLLVLLTLYFFFVVCPSRDHFVEPSLIDENASSSTNAGR